MLQQPYFLKQKLLRAIPLQSESHLRLIHSVADVVNNDERIEGHLKSLFQTTFQMHSYLCCIWIFQISVAGAEASGTKHEAYDECALTLEHMTTE